MDAVFVAINFLHSESTVIWKKMTFLEVPYLMAHYGTWLHPALLQ